MYPSAVVVAVAVAFAFAVVAIAAVAAVVVVVGNVNLLTILRHRSFVKVFQSRQQMAQIFKSQIRQLKEFCCCCCWSNGRDLNFFLDICAPMQLLIFSQGRCTGGPCYLQTFYLQSQHSRTKMTDGTYLPRITRETLICVNSSHSMVTVVDLLYYSIRLVSWHQDPT